MDQKYMFFSHRECEYFPCHLGADPENFNCLFCYCPLYPLGEGCGGRFAVLPGGRKDRSGCPTGGSITGRYSAAAVRSPANEERKAAL